MMMSVTVEHVNTSGASSSSLGVLGRVQRQQSQYIFIFIPYSTIAFMTPKLFSVDDLSKSVSRPYMTATSFTSSNVREERGAFTFTIVRSNDR